MRDPALENKVGVSQGMILETDRKSLNAHTGSMTGKEGDMI